MNMKQFSEKIDKLIITEVIELFKKNKIQYGGGTLTGVWWIIMLVGYDTYVGGIRKRKRKREPEIRRGKLTEFVKK